jgi:hypothetical protein
MKKRVISYLLLLPLLLAAGAQAQTTSEDSLKTALHQVKERLEGVSENMATLNSDVSILKWIKLSGYLQARYEYNDTSTTGITGGTDATKNLNANNLYIRRGRVKFSIQPGSTSKYVLYFDASKDKVSLKEAYVELYKLMNNHSFTLTAGQFNIPFGYEIEYSSSKRDFPERSLAENNLFKGERDRGVNLTWALPRYLQFNVAVIQGYGIEDSKFTWFSPTKSKHIIGRVKAKLGALDFGISGYHGTTYVPGTAAVAGSTTWYDANHDRIIDADEVKTVDAKTATAAKEYDKNRVGVDAQWYLDVLPVGGTGIRAEFYGARDKEKIERGWYLWLSQAIYKKFGAAMRYDYWDPNTNDESKDDATGTLSLAAHYFWDANVRITAAYDIPRPLKDNSVFSAIRNYTKQNRFTLQFQFTL